MTGDQLIHRFYEHEAAYWKEVFVWLRGPMAKHKAMLPRAYHQIHRLLVIPGVDGLVAAYFPQFRDLGYEPLDRLFTVDPLLGRGFRCCALKAEGITDRSISTILQYLTGNGVKLSLGGVVPPDVEFRGEGPRFRGPTVSDPETGRLAPQCVIEVSVDPPEPREAAVWLRECCIEPLDGTGEPMYPFDWWQLAIYGSAALGRETAESARKRAVDELLACAAKLINAEPADVCGELTRIVDEFEALLAASGRHEKPLHLFLKAHPILLSPYIDRCISEPRFGADYRPDFLLVVSPKDAVLVEIEHAEHRLFTKGGNATAELNHAVQQVQDWRGWLRSNSNFAQSSLGVPLLHMDSRALIVIGRSTTLSPGDAAKLKEKNASFHGATEILTYDDLLIRARQMVENLKRIRG